MAASARAEARCLWSSRPVSIYPSSIPSAISHQPSAMMRITIVAVLSATTVFGFQQQADRDIFARIRDEGMQRSQVAPVFEMFTVTIGPRLTASPAHNRAAEWARDRLASYGLAYVHLEGWKFGRGWNLDKLTVELTEPRYTPLIAYADGWSAPTS